MDASYGVEEEEEIVTICYLLILEVIDLSASVSSSVSVSSVVTQEGVYSFRVTIANHILTAHK